MNRLIAHGLIFGLGSILWLGAAILRTPEQRPYKLPALPYARPPHDPAAVDNAVRFFVARVDADPLGALNRAMLASAYLRRFQEEGDPSDLVRAEDAARRSLAIRRSNNTMALQTLVRCDIARHRFTDALALLRPDDPATRQLRAECLLETGRYDLARALVGAALLDTPDDPGLKTLAARLWDIDGHPERAEPLYREALALADAQFEISRPSLAWFHLRLAAHLTLRGRADDAAAQYETALEVSPDDPRALLGLARLRAAQGDTAGARDAASRAAARQPSAEAILLLADLARATGDTAEATRQETRALADAGAAHVHGRTLALYLARRGQRLDEALAFAQADLRQRQDIYSWDALAWVRFARGELTEADAAARRALARGTRDPELLFHAGRIALARGETARGRTLLHTALAIDSRFDAEDAATAQKLLEGNVSQ